LISSLIFSIIFWLGIFIRFFTDGYRVYRSFIPHFRSISRWTCYDGLRPDDAQEALFLLRQHLGPQASLDLVSGSMTGPGSMPQQMSQLVPTPMTQQQQQQAPVPVRNALVSFPACFWPSTSL
jgi:hypothetical protein